MNFDSYIDPKVAAHNLAVWKAYEAERRIADFALALAEAVDTGQPHGYALGQYRAAVTRHKAAVAEARRLALEAVA